MPLFIIKLILSLLVISVLGAQPALAVKIVRMELEYGSDIVATGGFDIPKTNVVLDLELFNDIEGLDLALFDGLGEAPPAPTATVNNFLNYVNSGRYDQTFFNRSVPDFIIQTGGVTNKPTDPDEPLGGAFGVVEEFPPVVNEPGLSNVRGTIAMARIGGQINSANSEWFINLVDNKGLDLVDEGFTVFGSVIDDGMDIADQIATFPVTDISFFFGGSYTDLPFADNNANDGEVITAKNLITVLSVFEINRPIVRFSPAVSNFGFESTGSAATGKTIDVVLRNRGNEILDIGSISTGSLDQPFSIQSENCSNASLAAVSNPAVSLCTVTLKFVPSVTGIFNSNLEIVYTGQLSGESFSVNYPLIGEGSLGPPVISAEALFDVGTSQVDGFSTTKDIVVSNTGQAVLLISSITTLNLEGFSQVNNCIGTNVLIAPGESCEISVTFTTSEFGTKVATLNIESNDLVNTVINITLSGNGDSDADGITTAIEDAAPNAGDNNFDGDVDSVQNNVASFVTDNGSYISLLAKPRNINFVGSNNVVSNLSVIPTVELVDLPSGLEFKHGDIRFQIDVDQLGAIAEVGLILPVEEAELKGYYFFGETDGNATPHWYSYLGVKFISRNQTFTGLGGVSIARDVILLEVQDGGPGDSDQIVNGKILLAHGAPAYSGKTSDTGSSSLNILFLCIFVVMMGRLKEIKGIFIHR